MKFTPHEYQKYAIEYIESHEVAALLLDMGLGKTVITLTALDALVRDSFEVSRVLIVAPLRVARDTWPTEIKKWEHLSGLTFSVVIGKEAERRAALQRRVSIYIVNRENVDWLIEKSGCFFDYDMVVIDELSSFKSHQTKRFKALMKVRPTVKRIVGLTGTPSSNGLMDLWAEFKLLDMGKRLGRFIGQYRETYFVPDKRSQNMVFSYKPRSGAEEEIYRQIADITISMKAQDFLVMPERIASEVVVSLSDKERDRYERMKAEMVVELGGKEIDAVSAAALSNKLLQLANGAVYDEDGQAIKLHARKLEALEDIIEAANGKPLLVAYWYKHDRERIMARFDAREIRTSEDITDWNGGRIPMALIHPASAGHGLNLQAGGSTLVWFGLTWSLELYQQTCARLWRQGQKNTVVIQHIIAKGTIDERVMSALAQKDKTQSALIEAVKAELEDPGKGRKTK